MPTPKYRPYLALAGAVAAAVGLFGVTLSAASTSTSLSVTASVNNNCTISTAALAFGAYDPVVTNASSPLDGTGTVTIACTKGATTTIGLGLGSNASGSTRRMTDGSGNYLTYEAYQDELPLDGVGHLGRRSAHAGRGAVEGRAKLYGLRPGRRQPGCPGRQLYRHGDSNGQFLGPASADAEGIY